MGFFNNVINKAKDAMRPKLPVIRVTAQDYEEFLEKWAWLNNERGNVLTLKERPYVPRDEDV